ncbi:hypothetical protein N7563_19040 [Leclercia adecarboxylata ATCC 23216 = NBRC 102595]|nr:hypothetical protein [Leclercia adecarboxylata ATCC 23216 = NBRC 102595]
MFDSHNISHLIGFAMAKNLLGLVDGVFITKEYALEAFKSFYSSDTHICEIMPRNNGYIYCAVPISKKITSAKPASINTKPMYGCMLQDRDENEALSEEEFWLHARGDSKAKLSKRIDSEDPTLGDEEFFEDETPLIDVESLPIIEEVEDQKDHLEAYNELEDIDLSELNDTNNNHHCIYCGDNCSGLQRDHVVSMAWRGGSRHYGKGHTIPSCPECNSILGDKAIHSVMERAEYLVTGIAKRNKASLNAQFFTEEELQELDPLLRREVIFGMQDKARIQRRINYASLVANGFYNFKKIKGLMKQGKEI